MSAVDREIVVLTAASGKQCSHLIPLLVENPRFALRLVVNSSSSKNRLQRSYDTNEGRVEVVQADLSDYESCARIVSGASTVYHINPNDPKEAEIGMNMVSAAVAERRKPDSKLKHFILSSVICSFLSKMLNHVRKLKVEEYLAECAAPTTGNLNWTIIQPGHLADALIGRLLAAVNKSSDQKRVTFENQFDADMPFSFLSFRDLAQVSATVIGEREKHYFASYGLVSTFPMPYSDFIHKVGESLNVDFDVVTLPYEKGVDANCVSAFGSKDVDQAKRDGSERLVLYYNKRGLIGNPHICSWLLGRPPTSIEDMVKDVVSRA